MSLLMPSEIKLRQISERLRFDLLTSYWRISASSICLV
jgi:hypothetical protein